MAIKTRIIRTRNQWIQANTSLSPGQSQQSANDLLVAKERICRNYRKLNEYFFNRDMGPAQTSSNCNGHAQENTDSGQTTEEDSQLLRESEIKMEEGSEEMETREMEQQEEEGQHQGIIPDEQSPRDLQLRELEMRREERQEELAFQREERQRERERECRRELRWQELKLKELALKKQELDERHERAMERLKYKKEKLEWLKSRDNLNRK